MYINFSTWISCVLRARSPNVRCNVSAKSLPPLAPSPSTYTHFKHDGKTSLQAVTEKQFSIFVIFNDSEQCTVDPVKHFFKHLHSSKES